MKSCPSCHADNTDNAKYCHMCGTEFPTQTINTKTILATLFIVCLFVGIGLYIAQNTSSSHTGGTSALSSITSYKLQAKNTISNLNSAIINNDFLQIERLYSSFVRRYHSKNNITNKDVVELYKNYDSKFGVYDKSIIVRWDTFKCRPSENGEFVLTYIIDYHIDRYDKAKLSDFVIEKHIELSRDYKIVSEYDIILSKH